MIWFTLGMLSVILINPHNNKLVSLRIMGAGSSAWLERSTDNRKVGSSNPPRPTIPSSHVMGLNEILRIICDYLKPTTKTYYDNAHKYLESIGFSPFPILLGGST